MILTALSAGMGEDARVWFAHRHPPDGDPEVRDVPGVVAARFLADELIEGLVNTAAAGYPVPLDVTVFGYRADEAGAVQLVPLLPGTDAARFVPLAELVERPVDPRGRDGDPRKWTAPAGCDGTAPAAAALAEAYRLAAVWLTGRYAARPPVVVHLTAGEGLDADYARVARSLGLLATAYGPARLLHVGFAPGVEPTLSGGWGAEVPEPWAGLFPVSAELPAEDGGRPARWAVSVNDWLLADAWSALFDLTPADDPGGWAEPDAARFDPATARGLWAEKMGNTPEQWEDAWASDPAGGVAAVADGASTGIYCRAWAGRLAAAFVAARPEARDPAALAAWVEGLRAEWRAGIDYEHLNWSKRAKVDSVGAAATLLGLEVGAAGDGGVRPWRACAVGDATLFWVRDGQLLATFPVVAADQFGSAPLLVRSNPGYKTLALAAAGECRPGDRFLLATDAVAARLLKSAGGVDWNHFEAVDEAAWRADLDALRRANDMVNDDCTLVVLAVAGDLSGRTRSVSDGVALEAPEAPADPPLASDPSAPIDHPVPTDHPVADAPGSPDDPAN